MNQGDEENLTKKIEELRKVHKKYKGISKEIVKTLEELEKSQKEYITMVKAHQE